MFEAAKRSEWPETFDSETLARTYITDTPVVGARPWIRRLAGPISGSFIVIGGQDVPPKLYPLDAPPITHVVQRSSND